MRREEGNNEERGNSRFVRAIAWGGGLVVAVAVVPAVVSSAVATVVGSGSVLAIGAGVHASVQAYNATMAASPIVAPVVGEAILGVVNGVSRTIDAAVRLAGTRNPELQVEDFVAVEADRLEANMDLAVAGYDALVGNQHSAERRLSL